jgi:endonuclease/exonuclease/phosphatase (EEP) superfamily protein YafD
MVGIPRQAMSLRLVIAATALAAIGLALAYVVAWIPVWPCALLEHFRVQYVELGVLATASAAVLRMRGYVDAAAIATLLHALPVTADLCRAPQPGSAGGVALRVLLLNVHTESSSFDQVQQLIADEQPDVVGLVEVDKRWIDGVAPALAGYTGRIEAPRWDNFGVALYARGRVAGAAEELGSPLPSVVAELAVGETRLRVILVHPPPPINAAALAAQYDEVTAIARRVAAREPTIVLGDFNATPWSKPFVELVARSGLCDSRAGFGIQPSFPTTSAVLRIPIDHLLASCAIGVRDRRIGRDVGSDHLPVILDLAIPR